MKRTIEEWKALFLSHEQSGVSAAQFCKEHGLCQKYFSLRKRQLGWAPQKSAFTQVVVAAAVKPSVDMELTCGAVSVCFGTLPEPVWLSELLRQLS